MASCVHHPGREAVWFANQKGYCRQCRRGIAEAVARVDRHVEPRGCFVWYRGSGRWEPIDGTGCAHWVAHQRGTLSRRAGEECLEGRPYRVRTLVQAMRTVPVEEVQADDIYVTPGLDHMGLVIRVSVGTGGTSARQITIRHDSSAQRGVAENEFATYFHARGTFRR